MKKNFLMLITCSFMLTSCYVHTYTVGSGPQTGIKERAKQHNFIFGLASGKTPDHKAMANGAKDYRVTSKHTFVDGLIANLLYGLYTPTTIIVER